MKVFSGDQPIEIALDPVEHILTKDLKQIKGIITQILNVCYGHTLYPYAFGELGLYMV